MADKMTQTIELEAALSPDYEKAFQSAEKMVKDLDKELGALGKREQGLSQLQKTQSQITKAAAEGNTKEVKKLTAQYERLANSMGLAGADAKTLQAELARVQAERKRISEARKPFADQLAMRRSAVEVESLRAAYDKFKDPRIAKQLQAAEARAKSLGVTFGKGAPKASQLSKSIEAMGNSAFQSIPGMGRLSQLFGKIPPQAMVVVGSIAAVTAAVIGLGKASLEQAKQTATSLDELAKNSRALGINVESYQRLSYAMRRGGASDEQFSAALKTLTKRMDEASEGSKEALKQFKALGLNIEDIKGKNPEEVFLKLADGIAAIEDPVERAKASTRLLGSGGMRVAEAMRVGADGLRALGKEAEKTGNVATERETELAEATVDAMENMRMSFEGIKKEVGVAVMPVLKSASEDITRYIIEHREGLQNFVHNVVLPSAEAVAALAKGAVKAISWVVEKWDAGTQIVANSIAFWVDTFGSIKDAGGEAIDYLGRKFDELCDRLWTLPATLKNLAAEAINAIIAGIEGKVNDLKSAVADVPLLGRLVDNVPSKFGRLDTDGKTWAERSAERAVSRSVTINNNIDARGAAPGAGADVQRAVAAGNGTAYGQMARRFADSGLAYGG